MSKDGTTLSFEIGRGDNTKTIEIKLAIKTMLNYANVVKGGAKPTAGYSADVWLERGSKTVAAQVNFRGGSPEGGRIVKGGSISGTIAAVGDGGKVITLQTPPKERGGEPTKTDIKIDAKTHITYSNVSLAGEKLTEGYSASVSLVEGSKDTAAAIALMPPKGEVKERLKSLHGPVVGVAKDGKSFTIEVPPAERGQPVEKVTIKITEHTRVIFNSVGLNGARLTQGHSASVTLNEGSQDTAYLVIFTPFEPARR